MDRIPSDIDVLDRGPGGLFRGKPHLVFGASGTGKSVLGLQFVNAGLVRGEAGLYVCRERAQDLVDQGERLGFPLSQRIREERLSVLEYDADFRDIAARQGQDALLDELRGQVDEKAVRRVVFDPVDPFFSRLEDESVLRAQLRAITHRCEALGWSLLLLCDDAAFSHRPHVLRVFSEACWGVFELRREVDGGRIDLRIYKMRNLRLNRSRFPIQIGAGGMRGVEPEVKASAPRKSPFAKFRPAPTVPSAALPREQKTDAATATLPEVERALADVWERAAPRGENRPVAVVLHGDEGVRRRIFAALAHTCDAHQGRDGMEGLDLVLRVRPDIVVLAASMPRLNGIGLCRILREHGALVPVLFVSDETAPPSERASAFAVGGDDCVSTGDLGRLVARTLALAERSTTYGRPEWPAIEASDALARLGPRRIDPAEVLARVHAEAARSREMGATLCLLGYEFRFADGPEGRRFVDLFEITLAKGIRAEDAFCRVSEQRLLAVLVGADVEGARRVVRRVHARMAAAASDVSAARAVKPKALYRILAVQPQPLDGESGEEPLIELLQRQPAHLIEEDQDERPGEPMEKYPLLEAVFRALHSDARECLSLLDGTRHPIRSDEAGRVRIVEIGRFRYFTQDREEEAAAGYRASRGAQIVWVELLDTRGRAVARIEEGRVFRGREV
ncbi:MAG TPA: ATPase domain-containing protein [Myxococcota bacterium]|nr:ATPase domain-containing protein [Myxococcota bacterium]